MSKGGSGAKIQQAGEGVGVDRERRAGGRQCGEAAERSPEVACV